ncbi:MAG: efflux RND transporter periplasmic adaptor subunit [Planctomycetes bacterium]|nr:efflux RND transporter periplasmic adaptor subunit [Planctomycetota bacterium]
MSNLAMNDHPNERLADRPARLRRLRCIDRFPFATSSLLAAIVAFGGCTKRSTSTPAAGAGEEGDAHDDHAGHDHGSSPESEAEHLDEVTLAPGIAERYGVATEAAQLWVLRPTIAVPARVGFNTEAMAHVGSPLRGRVAEVKVRVGDVVKSGQELLIVESPELGEAQAEFLQRRVAVQTAGPAVELSKVSWERAKGLLEQSQGISLTEVQRREAEYKATVAAQRAAESATTAAANRLHLLGMSHAAIEELAATNEVVPRYAIRAAIDGSVVQREVTLGELVSPDREYLMVLADTTKLWVLADVPESKLMDVHVGATAWVDIGSQGQVGARRFEGTVVFLSLVVDPTTRTAPVRIEVPVTEIGLRPGMFAQAEIVAANPASPDPPAVVAVREDAIQTVEGAPALFVPVPDEPGSFRKRAVTIGAPIGGLVPVLAGLVEGEPYVSVGTFILKAELGKSSAAHEH